MKTYVIYQKQRAALKMMVNRDESSFNPMLQAASGGGPRRRKNRGGVKAKKNALRCWPKVGELLALRIMLSVFPTSDYRHPVLTPANIFFGEMLSGFPVRGAQDASAGVFISCLQIEAACPVLFIHGFCL